ncbi:type II secretion system F family protein [Gordonia liuliyuniae]|uniref:Type II secretion system F family protein n=1 Tax=Gordonia liuliyuniae TaxID=2911517 RepID=A0ABS9ISZ3_9ACTN|nr:type II secretion system F family protein [Gordonia liuliyuniae]MCF8588683.1 type II secretion system F family protein [Gordonia liuliyuniae]
MTAALLAAGGIGLLLWPRPAVWSRLPSAERHRQNRRVDPVWLFAAAPVLAAAVIGVGPGIAIGIVAVTAIALRRRSVRRAELDRRRDELRRALSFMIAEMSVGAPVVLACRSAADELAGDGPSPVSTELARMAARAELGGDPADAAAGGAGDVGIDRLATAWAASSSRGLPMADLLQMLRSDLSARADHASRTRAGLAGPRATAMVLALLPILGIGLGHLMGAAPLAVLLSPGIGAILLVVGAALVSAGVWWTNAITEKALR